MRQQIVASKLDIGCQQLPRHLMATWLSTLADIVARHHEDAVSKSASLKQTYQSNHNSGFV
jgi:hypothetical protein